MPVLQWVHIPEQTVVFTDRTAIPIDQISEIESELFRGLELFDL